VGEETKLCTHMCRTILDHTPIGDYYHWFNIPEEHSCLCGAARQSQEHLFTRCLRWSTGCTSRLLNELVGYLVQNPGAFGFHSPLREDQMNSRAECTLSWASKCSPLKGPPYPWPRRTWQQFASACPSEHRICRICHTGEYRLTLHPGFRQCTYSTM
jgi:hypothetical protein